MDMEVLKKIVSDAIILAWTGMIIGAGVALGLFAVCALLLH